MKFIKKFWSEYKQVIIIFLIWRTYLLFLGLISFKFLTFKASFPFIDEFLINSGLPQALWQWGNFDGVHFLAIAQHGYTGIFQSEQVFFPLFPILIKLISYVTGNYFISGLLLSNLAVLAAGILLYRIVTRDFNKNTAIWSVVFLFLFPTSFFFGSIYTESLFLLLLLCGFYLTKPFNWLFNLLAGLTRLIGAFTGIFGVFGVLVYMFYQWLQFSSPFLFLFSQGAFTNGRASSFTTLVLPPQVMYRYIKIFLTANPGHYDFWVAVLEFSAFILGGLILGFLTWKKRVKLSYLLFGWLALLLPAFSGTFSSMPRYLLTIFPLYIFLAQIKSFRIRAGVGIIFFILLSILTVHFLRGYWIS